MLEFLGSLAFGLGLIYLAPTLIAYHRNIRGMADVVLVNLLLGWTIIGWLWALAMAFGNLSQEDFNRRYGLSDD